MQLRTLVIYHADGRFRSIDFKLNALNVITGASRTGKSAILEIVDYCFASNSFRVPAGVVKDSVHTYALVLSVAGGEVLVARPAPPSNRQTTARMHLRFGRFDQVPTLESLAPNTDTQAVRAVLSESLGIRPNQTDPGSGSRPPIRANVRHALNLVLQSQGEVANPGVLFHSQLEEFVPQSIRDTFPYFLGAVTDDDLATRETLRDLRRQQRQLLRESDEDSGITGPTDRAQALLLQAVDVGLIEREQANIQTHDEAVRIISQILESPDEPRFDTGEEDGYEDLLDERQRQRQRVNEIQSELRLLDHVAAERLDFGNEATEQIARLTVAANLPGGDVQHDSCPLCGSSMDSHIASVDEFRAEADALQQQVTAVQSGDGRLQVARARLDGELAEVREELRRSGETLELLSRSRTELARFRDAALRRAGVRGQLAIYLDAASRTLARVEVGSRLSELEAEIERLEESLADADGALDSILSRVSDRLTRIARSMELEHSDSPVRLDLRGLTVVADTANGRVPMTSMGSGENWLGYHVAALLALQEWFIETARPVPRFLLLDQPSQVYFPTDPGDGEDPAGDEDLEALGRILGAMVDAIEGTGALQVIITDHADLPDDWFSGAVLERWRGGLALVPAGWISEDN